MTNASPISRLSFAVNALANLQVTVGSFLLLVLGLVMTMVILLQVFARYVIYLPLPWSEELARYLMIWLGMLGSVVALRRGRHIGVRVFVDKLPPGIYDRYLVPLVQCAMLAFLAVLLKEGVALAVFNAEQLSPGLELPMLVPYLAIPTGAAMMMLNILADMLEDRWPTPAGSRAKIASATMSLEDASCPAPDEGEARP